MVRRRPVGELADESAAHRFRVVRGRGRGLGALRMLSHRSGVGLSIRSERPRELTLEFGTVRSRAGRISAATGRRRARWGELEVELAGSPPGLTVRRRGAIVFETPTELPQGKLPGPAPWGTSGAGLTLPLRFVPGERVLGAGEFFGPVDRIGQELRTSVCDVFGLPNDGTYVTYPFFWSTRGYAFLAETWAPVRFDFGRRYLGLGEVELPRTPVTVRLFFSRSPREIVRWFWDRRGAPAIPPLWSYGIWYSRCAYRDQRELLRVARRVRALRLPGDVIHLDPPWLDQPLPDALYAVGRRLGLSRAAVDRSAEKDPGDALAGLAARAAQRGWFLPYAGIGCTFRWNRRRFPDPAGMIQELHRHRLRLSLWINPYVPAHTPEYDYLRSRDLLLRRGDGRVGLQFDRPSTDFGGVDLTHPEGRRWFAARVAELVRLGVDVIKTDFGEAVPADGYGRKLGPPELHNRYATLYPETVFRAVRTAGGDPMVWGRSGGLDIHRYPVQWGGDPRTLPRDMGAALRGALSYSASGGAFSSFDSGGFGGRPTPELYVRWMQMGMLFSHTRLHGTTPREPWSFGPRALRIFRAFAALRYRLIPYLYSESVRGVREGRPLVRPLAFDDPEDAVGGGIDDEYLLGRSLLVAPVIPGGRSDAYVPAGRWFDFWTGHRIEGPTWIVRQVPWERVPLLVRDASVLPMTRTVWDRTDPAMLRDLVVRVYGSPSDTTVDFGRYGRLHLGAPIPAHGSDGRFRWRAERRGR
jgi:alpha-D-xyloside xylohydrolase